MGCVHGWKNASENLNNVKRNHDVRLYPNELIHCICEALNIIVHHPSNNAQRIENIRLRKLLLPIKEYIVELTEPELSMKRRRKFLSKPQVGKGVFTALASFVIPALISLISKKIKNKCKKVIPM